MQLDEHRKAEFDKRRQYLEKYWANCDESGNPRSENKKILDVLRLELEFSDKSNADLENVAWHAFQWLETRNPHYADAAFLCCCNVGITPPPTLINLMQEVALVRSLGLELAGSAKQVRDQAILSEALRNTCGLHLTGASIDLATSKAARFISDQEYGKTYKASTLEKNYAKTYRTGDPSLEQQLREAYARASKEKREEWERLLAELPEASDDLKGSAR